MTDPNEFLEFYELLMTDAPTNYSPWLFTASKSDKIPHLARGSWSLLKNKKTVEQAVNLMRRGFNIGIAGMDDHLMILDVDDETAIDVGSLVPTLSVRSRSRTGSHHFYFIDDINKKRNIAVPGVGELRAQHQYVICCGSYTTTDPKTVPLNQRKHCGRYTLENAIPPAHITFQDLPEVFKRQYMLNYLIPSIKDKMSHLSRIFGDKLSSKTINRKSKSALSDLEVSDVVHVPRDGRNFASPLHGSKNGKNCTYSDGWLRCFRCGVSHNAITLLAVMAGIATCSSAGYGHKHSCAGGSSVNMSDGETVYAIWDFARRSGYIPKDDIPPYSVLVWYALKENRFETKYLIDGWQLPSNVYEWVVAEIQKVE